MARSFACASRVCQALHLGVHAGQLDQVDPAPGLLSSSPVIGGGASVQRSRHRRGGRDGLGEGVGAEAPDRRGTSGGPRCAGRASASTRPGTDQAQRLLLVAGGDGAAQRGAQVLVLALQPVDGGALAGAAQQRVGGAGEFAVVRRGGARSAAARSPGLVQPLAGVLADGLQQPVAHLAVGGRGRRRPGTCRRGSRARRRRRGPSGRPHTASAAARSQPPAKTDSRRRTARSGSSSRSQDQSTTARRVCWRGRTVRLPLVSSRKRSSRRSAIWRGVSSRSRAAASSMASGSPSRRRQISAQAAGSSSASTGSRAGPRRRGRRAAAARPGRAAAPRGRSNSPGTPRGSRLVARTVSPGQRASSRSASRAAASTTCSQLSRTSSMRRRAQCSASRARGSSCRSVGGGPHAPRRRRRAARSRGRRAR